LPGLSLFLAHSRSEAQALFEQAHAHLDRPQRLAKLASILGTDVAGLPADRPLAPEDFAAPAQPVRSRTHAELLMRRIAAERPALDALLQLPEVVSSAHWQVVGTPADAVEQILAWRAAGAIDGVIALPGGSLGSLALFLEQVVPALQAAGSARAQYAEGGFLQQIEGR
jgi:alkanesulfonate monooxygenase SsuD/methylene tetrahydromethanopterin reductase-like flavin-dependent oxidoreductase (luciferase family)